MILGQNEGLKGCAARTGTPALALDPSSSSQCLPDMPFRAGVPAASGGSSLLCTPSDISILRRQRCG